MGVSAMISFVTPTVLPIEAATTMGVSVKEADGAIGKFGTGLKYAIAGVLRLGGKLEIQVEEAVYTFTAKPSSIRGRDFLIVHCNDQPCGFTTDLGKHWEPWQLFRELASNTLDEGGSWVSGEAEGKTIIRVQCRQVEESEKSDAVFLPDSRQLARSAHGATIHSGPSKHYYFRGIRAGSFTTVAPVTVNVSSGTLSEDRLLDQSTVELQLTWTLATAHEFDEQMMLSAMSHSQQSDFWVRHTNGYAFQSFDLSEQVFAFLADRPKFIKNPALLGAFNLNLKRKGGAKWEQVPITDRHRALLEKGLAVCESSGIDPIPFHKVRFTRDLSDDTLAVTCMDTREVWFSTKIAAMGEDEFMSCYLEEAIHSMTGFADCTREFQNLLLSLAVTNHKAKIRTGDHA